MPVSVTLSPGCYGSTTLPSSSSQSLRRAPSSASCFRKRCCSASDGGDATATNLSAWSTSERGRDGHGDEHRRRRHAADGVLQRGRRIGRHQRPGDAWLGNPAPPARRSRPTRLRRFHPDGDQPEPGMFGADSIHRSRPEARHRPAPGRPRSTSRSFSPRSPARRSTRPTVAQPILNITSSASLASTDGTFGALRWFEMDDAADYINGSWLILAPPGVMSMKTPALPPSLSAWVPSATSMMSSRRSPPYRGRSSRATRRFVRSGSRSFRKGSSVADRINGPTIPPSSWFEPCGSRASFRRRSRRSTYASTSPSFDGRAEDRDGYEPHRVQNPQGERAEVGVGLPHCALMPADCSVCGLEQKHWFLRLLETSA